MQHTLTGRFEVRLISHEALASYMTFRGFTVRSLAQKIGTSPALVGHLRSGKRSTCSTKAAMAIERTLDAPRGSLFVPKVSHVVGYAA